MRAALLHLARCVFSIGLVLLACAGIGYCSKAHAEAFTFGVHLATAHFGGNDLQPLTPGAYVRVDSGPVQGLTGGAYRNSYDRTSGYIGWSVETADRCFAVTLGAVTGYSAARVMPLVVPSARIPIAAGLALRIAYIPKPLKEGHAPALHVATEFDF